MGEYLRRVRKVLKYPALYNFDLLQRDNTRGNTFVCLVLRSGELSHGLLEELSWREKDDLSG